MRRDHVFLVTRHVHGWHPVFAYLLFILLPVLIFFLLGYLLGKSGRYYHYHENAPIPHTHIETISSPEEEASRHLEN